LIKAGSDITLRASEKVMNGAVVDQKTEGEKIHTRDSSAPTSSGVNKFGNLDFRAKLEGTRTCETYR